MAARTNRLTTVLCWWFLSLVFAESLLAQQRLTEFVSEKELRTNIDRWRVARESYYLHWYEKPVSIGIEAEESTFLVRQYAARKLDAIFSRNKELSRLVIKRDLGVVLDRSFIESVRSSYGTLTEFLLGEGNRVSLKLKDIQAALEAEDCNVIPCPPEKCKPDCSPKSFKRFSQ